MTEKPSNVIYSIEELKNSSSHGDLFESERRLLGSLAMLVSRNKPVARYLEVGVFGGGTINFVRRVVADTGRVLQCTGVDLFEDFQIIGDNTHASGNFTITDVQNF